MNAPPNQKHCHVTDTYLSGLLRMCLAKVWCAEMVTGCLGAMQEDANIRVGTLVGKSEKQPLEFVVGSELCVDSEDYSVPTVLGEIQRT